jgi:hypothetical protein
VIDQWPADPAFVTAELDRIKAEYRRALVDSLHWRGDDLGDVYAFSLLQAYIKVRGREPAQAPIARLRREVRDDIALQKRVRRLPDARKQEAAEALELRTLFLISDMVKAQMAGDAAAEASARAAMRTWAKDVYGIDVDKVRLTRRGFVRR